METRDEALLKIRPIISSALVNTNMKAEEIFQNRTLRPVIKLQNDLLIEVFRHYVAKHKHVFFDLSTSKKMDYIETAIHKDMKFRNSIKGIIIGQFTIAEHQEYTLNSSSLNKRLTNLIMERLKDNLLHFEKVELALAQ